MYLGVLVPKHHRYTSNHRNHLLRRSYLNYIRLHMNDIPYLHYKYVLFRISTILLHI